MKSKTKKTLSDPTKIGASTSFDTELWQEILNTIDRYDIGDREILENFMLFVRRVNFAKFITHIEIFKHVVDLPGSIVECGVFKGMSLMTFLKLVEVLCPGDSLKKVIGFDTFSGFNSLSKKDGEPDKARAKVLGGFNASDFEAPLREMIEISQKDSMVPRVKRVELVKGDVVKTIPKYVKDNPGLRICLLHLDVDLYEPTLVALEQLYPLIVPGGVLLLDEYAMNGFPGESAAFDEYFGKKRPLLTKFPFSPTPGGYYIKDH